MRVAVVGAGIIGLSTGYELARAGVDVRVYERTDVASQQSRGNTRIFRSAHADAHLVRLATRARACWAEWEARFERRLVGGEGLILTGAEFLSGWREACLEAGVPVSTIGPDETRSRLPIGNLPDARALLDPTGGATRVLRVVDLLRAAIGERIHLATVSSIEQRGGGCIVHADDGDWECDEVVLTAGIDTVRLAEPLDLGIEQRLTLHSRFTFEIRDDLRTAVQACWIDEREFNGLWISAYAQAVGTTGRYALGLSWEGEANSIEVGPDEVSRRSLEVVQEYVAALLPGLRPEPMDELRCIWGRYPFLDGDDGFIARRSGRVTAFYGNNLFKFAPLLGALLRDAAMHGAVPPELRAMDTQTGHAS